MCCDRCKQQTRLQWKHSKEVTQSLCFSGYHIGRGSRLPRMSLERQSEISDKICEFKILCNMRILNLVDQRAREEESATEQREMIANHNDKLTDTNGIVCQSLQVLARYTRLFTVARICVSYSDFNTKPIRIRVDYRLDMAIATLTIAHLYSGSSDNFLSQRREATG